MRIPQGKKKKQTNNIISRHFRFFFFFFSVTNDISFYTFEFGTICLRFMLPCIFTFIFLYENDVSPASRQETSGS